MSSFNPNDGAFISKTTAQDYTANYRNNSGSNAIDSHFFGLNKLKEVIGQEDVIGIRIYYGLKEDENENLVQELIIVGVDENGDDILNTNKILDHSRPCPPYCPDENSETL